MLYKIGAEKNHFLCSEKSKSTVFDLDRETKKRKYAKEYYKVFDSLNKKEEYIKRSDYIPVTYLIQKFIANEGKITLDEEDTEEYD